MREFIIQMDQTDLDLYEYKSDKSMISIRIHSSVVEIVDIISKCKNSIVWVEKMPLSMLIMRDLRTNGIWCEHNYDAEAWLKYIWYKKYPPMKFISYWEYFKPMTIDEQNEFNQRTVTK